MSGVFCVLVAVAAACFAYPAMERPWMNVDLTPRQRAQALLAQMQQTEKLAMVHGYGAHGGTSGYVGR